MRIPIAVLAASIVVVLMGPASAESTMMTSADDTSGGFISCPGHQLVPISGQVIFNYHLVTGPDGPTSANGHGVAHDVTLLDQAGTTYMLRGMTRFNEHYDPSTGDLVSGSATEEFTIVDAGGVLGRISVVTHVDRDGALRIDHFGECTENFN